MRLEQKNLTLGILYDKFLDMVNEIKKSEQEKILIVRKISLFAFYI